MYVLIPLGVVSLAGIIYMAVSRKSSFKHRVAALVALALMIITVIICLFQIFGPSAASKATYYPPDMPPSSVPESQESNTGIMIALIIFLLLLFMAVLMLSIREYRNSKGEQPKGKKVHAWD